MGLDKELTSRYLLGTMTDAEEEEIAVRVIEEPLFAEEVSQAEHDLIEEYLEGTLSASEHDQFEQQFLISDDRRERVRMVALLKKYAMRSTKATAVAVESPRTNPWYRSFRILAPAFGVLVVFAAALILLLQVSKPEEVQTDSPNPPGSTYDGTRAVQRDLSDLSAVTNAQVVLILPGAYRTSSPGSITVVTGSSPTVLFRLPLTFPVVENTVYDASIERGPRKVFGVEPVRLYNADGVLEARILVPRGLLSSGEHQIILVARDSDKAPVIYTFEVR